MKLSWIIFPIILLVSCSDFNLGYVPGGDPRPPIIVHDTLVDTLIVPADSLIVYARYSYRDTILKDTVNLRSHNTLELRMKTDWSAIVDTVGLFGVAICKESLDVGISRDSTRVIEMDSLKVTLAGGLGRYEVYHSLYPESEYAVRWTNTSSDDASLSLEMLLGYTSQDSSVQQTTEYFLREIRDVVSRSQAVIAGNAFFWEKVAVQPGDSLWGVFQPDSGLNAYLLRSVEMDDLLMNGVLGDGLWNSKDSSDIWSLKVSNGDTLYYVIENQTEEDLDLSDTLQLIREIF